MNSRISHETVEATERPNSFGDGALIVRQTRDVPLNYCDVSSKFSFESFQFLQ